MYNLPVLLLQCDILCNINLNVGLYTTKRIIATETYYLIATVLSPVQRVGQFNKTVGWVRKFSSLKLLV